MSFNESVKLSSDALSGAIKYSSLDISTVVAVDGKPKKRGQKDGAEPQATQPAGVVMEWLRGKCCSNETKLSFGRGGGCSRANRKSGRIGYVKGKQFAVRKLSRSSGSEI